MLQVIITQILNHIAIGVENFLKVRGILEPQGGKYQGFETQKDLKDNQFAMGSSQDQLNMKALDDINAFLAESEKLIEKKIDLQTLNYKESLIEAYKMIEDPFDREIKEINFDQNPSDTTQLMKSVILMNPLDT